MMDATNRPRVMFLPGIVTETRARLREDFARRDQLPPPERMRGFIEMQLAPGVPPPPPPGPPPDWMEKRPAGIEAFAAALQRFRLEPERLRTFDRPVYYSHGSLSARH